MSSCKMKLRPADIAERWGISIAKVISWIRSGELRAINAATTQVGRPRFLIDPADLEAFEQRRAVVPPPEPAPRRRKKDPEIVEYF